MASRKKVLPSKTKSSSKKSLNFQTLVKSIHQIHDTLLSRAARAVNIELTLRNWFIGLHISEFELHGADRAKYGEGLLDTLSKKLESLRISNCNKRQLYRYTKFYRIYPQIVGTLSPLLQNLLPPSNRRQLKVGTLSPQLTINPDTLLSQLSYSHIELILESDDPIKRAFYEEECIKAHWSVRQLRRQIASLYFERTKLSRNKKRFFPNHA